MRNSLSTIDALTAGNATVTLIQPDTNRHWTFTFKRGKVNPRLVGVKPPMFVSVMQEGRMDYAGILVRNADVCKVKRTHKSKVSSTAVAYRAVNWMLQQVDAGFALDYGFEIKWSNKCVRCGRKLTSPSSIDSRIGPECAKHF